MQPQVGKRWFDQSHHITEIRVVANSLLHLQVKRPKSLIKSSKVRQLTQLDARSDQVSHKLADKVIVAIVVNILVNLIHVKKP